MKVFLYIVLFISCQRNNNPLEIALRASAGNRLELEKVLEHYAQRPSDSLRLKAAEFLISQMPGHYSLSGSTVEEYVRRVDSLKFIPSVREVLKSAIYRYPAIVSDLVVQEDLKCIKADYLIQHIDHLFELWALAPWLEFLKFEDFCDYLLPYRVGNELLQSGYSDGERDKSDIQAYLEDYDDTKTSVDNLSRAILAKRVDCTLGGKQIVLPLIGDFRFNCYDEAVRDMIIYRWLGIPAALDYIPFWASSEGGHYCAAPIDRKIRNNSVLHKFQRNVAKVYRKTFAHHPFFCSVPGEYIPPLFTDPFLLDVTEEYVHTSDVHIPFQCKWDRKYAYLAVFNGQKWEPIAGSESHDFRNMGREVVYQPVGFQKQQMINLSYPFVLDSSGEIHYLIPDTTVVQKLHLLRKYPVESRKEFYNIWIKGTRIEASNDADFETRDTLWNFQTDPVMKLYQIRCEADKRYRYVRILPARYANVAEISFYDSLHYRVEGVWTSEMTENMNLAYDGDPLTYARVGVELKCDFGKSRVLSKLFFLPMNDGNGIFPGQTYELFYMGKNGWISCGAKVATDYCIDFERVPSGALYWLRNRTVGKEERIFTYVNGRVRFW